MVGSEFAWNMNVYIQDNIPCHKAPAILKWFLEHDNEFIVLKQLPQSTDLNPIGKRLSNKQPDGVHKVASECI